MNINAVTVAKSVGVTVIAASAVSAIAATPKFPDPIKAIMEKNKDNPWFGTGFKTALIGVAGLLLYENPALGKLGTWPGLKFGSWALIAGGVMGAALAAVNTLANSKMVPRAPGDGLAELVDLDLPKTVEELAGRELARAEAATKADVPRRTSIYIDAATKKPGGATVEEAYMAARKASRTDGVKYRSFAVLQTADGAFWIAALAQLGGTVDKGGSIDKIDGPMYVVLDATLDRGQLPRIQGIHSALLGIAGVDNQIIVREPREVE